MQNNGADSLYYCYTDYQGNLLAVTDDAGNVLQRMAYDAWGMRRNPNNWIQNDTDIDRRFISRGYTMHEHLDAFGLINMNGRVYDPYAAQFLSPDPFIQAPDNWANYNRYGYCLNNPLMYTDPSGEKIKFPKWKPRHWIPVFGQFDYLIGMINENTTKLRQKMVDAKVPDFGVGINSAGKKFHYVGNSGNIYHNQLGVDYLSPVNAAIEDARGEYATSKGGNSAARPGIDIEQGLLTRIGYKMDSFINSIKVVLLKTITPVRRSVPLRRF